MRPLCIEGLLDRGSFHYDPLNDHWMSARPKEPCRLHRYSMRNVLTCLESVRPSRTNSSRPLRFIFAGDSRIRQQFYNFLRFLPDYDRTALPDSKVNWNDKRQDRSMFSSLVNVNVTFLWRHLVTPEFISEMDKLASVEPPAFILIGSDGQVAIVVSLTVLMQWWLLRLGISVHHMVKYNQADQRIFEEKLTQFIPVLNRLTRQGTRVIWTDQYRLYDVQNLEVEHLEVSTANVMHMNRLTRRILKYINFHTSLVYGQLYSAWCVIPGIAEFRFGTLEGLWQMNT